MWQSDHQAKCLHILITSFFFNFSPENDLRAFRALSRSVLQGNISFLCPAKPRVWRCISCTLLPFTSSWAREHNCSAMIWMKLWSIVRKLPLSMLLSTYCGLGTHGQTSVGLWNPPWESVKPAQPNRGMDHVGFYLRGFYCWFFSLLGFPKDCLRENASLNLNGLAARISSW